jgi:Effector-associated domain 7
VSIDHAAGEQVVRIEALRAYLERELPRRSDGRERCVVAGQGSGDMIVARLGQAPRGELRVEILPQAAAAQATVAIYHDDPETMVAERSGPPFHFNLFQHNRYAIIVRTPGYSEEVSYSEVGSSPHSVRLREIDSGVLGGHSNTLAQLLIKPSEPLLPVRLYNSNGYRIDLPPRKPRGYLLKTPPDHYRAVLVTPERNVEQEIEALAGQSATIPLPFNAFDGLHPLDKVLLALDNGQSLDVRLSHGQAALIILARSADGITCDLGRPDGAQQVALAKLPGDVVDLLRYSYVGAPGPIWVTFHTADEEIYQLLLPLLPGRMTIVGLAGAGAGLPSIEILLAPTPLLRRHSAAQKQIILAQRFFKAERRAYVPSMLEGLADEPLALALAGYTALSSKDADRARTCALHLQAIAPTLGDGTILLAAAEHMQGRPASDPPTPSQIPFLLSGLQHLIARKPPAARRALALQVFQRAVLSQIWLVVRGDEPIAAPDTQEHAAGIPKSVVPLAALRHGLVTHFDASELRDLCFDLGIDYEALPGESKGDKARELVAYTERRGRTVELATLCRQLRPDADWD